MARRATNRATKLSELERTELTDDGLSKPQPHQPASFDRYRTQEVAGSSPASSIQIAGNRTFSLRLLEAIAGFLPAVAQAEEELLAAITASKTTKPQFEAIDIAKQADATSPTERCWG
jgi:hypothetical protein